MRYWFDTEFIERGARHPITLLSIGIVSEDRRELYFQNADISPALEGASPWVWENVLSHFDHAEVLTFPTVLCPYILETCGMTMGADERDENCPWLGADDIAARIEEFMDPATYGKPEIWAYYADYDWVVLCQLFGTMLDLPEEWPKWCRDVKQLCWDVGDPSLPDLGHDRNAHHALTDARWAKDTWANLWRKKHGPMIWQRELDAKRLSDIPSVHESRTAPPGRVPGLGGQTHVRVHTSADRQRQDEDLR